MSTCALAEGGHLTYETYGEGPPILLLRPLGGSLVSWDRFAASLARRMRVIAFDPRGVGRSSAAPALGTTRDMARDARALLDHLAIARAHVYGISMGGMVASWLAIDAPTRVATLVLASTLPRGVDVSTRGVGRAMSLATCLVRHAGAMDACFAARVLSRHFVDERPDEVARIRELAAAYPSSRLGLVALLGAVARHDVRGALHRITAPTLVLRGERDPLVTEASQVALYRAIPRVTHDVIRGAGHDVSAEAPESVADQVTRFADRWRRVEEGLIEA